MAFVQRRSTHSLILTDWKIRKPFSTLSSDFNNGYKLNSSFYYKQRGPTLTAMLLTKFTQNFPKEEEEGGGGEGGGGRRINKQNRFCGLPAIAASTTKYLCIPAWHAVFSEEQHCATLFLANDDSIY